MTRQWTAIVRLAVLCAACGLGNLALPAEPAHQHDAQAHPQLDHMHHAEQAPGYARKLAKYRVPATTLVRSDGTKARFPDELDDGKPVLLEFIYTTCTAVCPILSQSFSELQRGLGGDREKVHMMSISIDPEEDTPQRLAEYARRFEAGSQWRFYTGQVADSLSLQRAFQAYFGDKMHHRPMTFLRAAPGEPWVRIEGFATPDELLKEYRQLIAAR
jgi:protein SCO1/2